MPPTSNTLSCRRKIVGWDCNAPDPFPGFGGTVGLGQDLAVAANGDWLLVFHAGYWHMSAATPFVIPDDERLERMRANGLPDIDAPNGGRVMAVRSRDAGVTWSRPQTLLNGRWDEGPVGLSRLSDGTLLMLINNQASWYGLDAAPPGHLPVNTRIGVMRSTDHGQTWSDVAWLESPQPFYQRAYAPFLELPDGGVLVPAYGAEAFDAQLHGAVHRSDDGGATWRLIATLEREDGEHLDEPTLTLLPDGRLMMLSRLDAAVFYSEDAGATWRFSHPAPFAPFKAHRTAVLDDGTVVCWMTSHGTLRASWSTDGGRTWALDDDDKPFSLDAGCYGYPGGCLLDDGSIMAVYYDAANGQRRTSVWGIRFRINEQRTDIDLLPAPGAESAERDERHPRRTAAPDDDRIDVDAM